MIRIAVDSLVTLTLILVTLILMILDGGFYVLFFETFVYNNNIDHFLRPVFTAEVIVLGLWGIEDKPWRK